MRNLCSEAVSGWTSAVTWNTVDTGLEFVLGCYRKHRVQYADGRVEESCESKMEQGRSQSHSGPIVRADLSGHLKYSQRWSGVCAGVLLGAQGAVHRGENRGEL